MPFKPFTAKQPPIPKKKPDTGDVKGARKSAMNEPTQKTREGHDIGMKGC